MRVAIVENTAITHHGQVGVALHEAGARIRQFRPFADGALPDAADFDALVVFGGEQNACADAQFPYLPELARRMRAFSEADRAVLGICLGAQILARGFGSQNLIGGYAEFGWCGIEALPLAAADPVFSALPAQFPLFQWHSDSFTLPAGAIHLARSGAALHQAFRMGRATYGTQFHFEANRRVVADWSRSFPVQMQAMRSGWDRDHAAEAASLGIEADRVGLDIARGFVALIGA
ncbi:type 1 glutamine amidotransferase [Gemmobacter serpentinus]|uniref:type 1 glutamine amidotransferase n=1 Tax=Gemmobacter serpentinus TaxID=2652247 RepID=UPI00124DD42B|nr:type 1 glutamine amidotransferase [Gemmobacter serpentinus]